MSRCQLLLALTLGCLIAGPLRGQGSIDSDQRLLKSQGIGTDSPDLLEYFQRQTPSPENDKRIAESINFLRGPDTAKRDEAIQKLVRHGPTVIPHLKTAMKDASPETMRGVEVCLRLVASPGPEQPIAAARILAQRHVYQALPILVAFAAQSTDPWVHDELLNSIGRLGVHGDKVDRVLIEALKDPVASRRSVASFVLAQRAGFAHRAYLRGLLEDRDAGVRRKVMSGLIGKRILQTLADTESSDVVLLKKHGLRFDEAELLAFLRKHTLSAADQQNLQSLIRQLGDRKFALRAEATRKLVAVGSPALAYLGEALRDADVEIARRAHLCISEIQQGPGPALPAAVIRTLGRVEMQDAKNDGTHAAVNVLLNYVPFAEDESLAEEVLSAMCVLSTLETRIEPLLIEALSDPDPARRATAAYVLGHVGTESEQGTLRKLLQDPAAQVRWRAAQGLIAGRDTDAVPVLISLLGELPASSAWQVEEQLYRLASDQGPSVMVASGAAKQRAQAVKSWMQWWQSHGSTVDLAASEDDHFLGLYTICEYDSTKRGQQGGRVWETSRDGKPRWEIAGVTGAMDAQVLPNGRVLVAENPAGRVTERDLQGNVRWQYEVKGNPIACQRLKNGNTFIATYNHVLEVTPDGKELYRHGKGPGFYIFSAQKTRAGQIVCMSAQGTVVELDPQTGKDLRRIELGSAAGWCSVEALPNGRFLVATLNNGQIREVDAAGTTHWSVNFAGAFRATRLPNGNTIVASMTQRRIAEFDRNGNLRWQRNCEGRPWAIRYR